MATHKVNIDVRERGAGRAAGELKRVDRAIGGVAKAAIGAAGALLGAAGLIAGFKAVIRAAGEQEQAERQLSVALGHSSKALLAQAAALQQVSTYGDETIIRAQALIAAFVDDEDQIKAATKATLDLAAAKGMDLVTAADLVSKTLGSTTNALSRYGIQVEGAVGSSQRLSTLTSEIAAKFGGQAAAAAHTMMGEIEQAKMAAGDAAEVLGKKLAPVVIALSRYVKANAEEWGEWADGLNDVAGPMLDAASTFAGLGDGVLIVADALVGVIDVAISVGGVFVNLAQIADRFFHLDFAGVADNWAELTMHFTAGGDFIMETLGAIARHAENMNAHFAAIGTHDNALKKQGETAADAAPKVVKFVAAVRELGIEYQGLSGTLQEYSTLQLDAQAELEAALDAQAAQHQSRYEAEKQRIEDQVLAWQTAGADAVQIAQWQDAEEEKLHQSKKRRDQLEAASHASMIGGVLGGLAALNRSARGNAVVTKRLMQGQAILDTYAAANRALATGVPPWSYVQAGISVAMGLANVARIQAQKFARGGDFVTAGPQMIVVGDNPGGRERVQVQPLSSPNFDGPQGSNIELHFHGAITDESYVEEIIVPAIARAQRLGAA